MQFDVRLADYESSGRGATEGTRILDEHQRLDPTRSSPTRFAYEGCQKIFPLQRRRSGRDRRYRPLL